MTTKKLYMYLFHKVAEDLVEVITSYTRQIVIPEKQNDSAATYTRRLSRDDGRIPLEMIQGALKGTHTVLPSDQETLFSTALKAAPNTSVAIERMLRALSPWPGVWTEVMIHGESKRLKILDVHVDNGKLTPGKVQLEGKNPVDWEQFISAYDIAT